MPGTHQQALYSIKYRCVGSSFSQFLFFRILENVYSIIILTHDQYTGCFQSLLFMSINYSQNRSHSLIKKIKIKSPQIYKFIPHRITRLNFYDRH